MRRRRRWWWRRRRWQQLAVGKPAYVNHTATGQCGNDDLGFSTGAQTDPADPVATTAHSKLTWDIMNGYSSTASSIGWRVLHDGAAFDDGTVASIAAFSWTDLEVEITPGAGTHTYRIEIDPDHDVSETNENNDWVEVTVAIPAAAPG